MAVFHRPEKRVVGHLLLSALLLSALFLGALLLASCSDDSSPVGPGPTDANNTGQEGGTGDGGAGEMKYPWDGFDPQCPLAGPCIITISTEKQHVADVAVIGEILTLDGRELQDVQKVFIGTAEAPILSITASQLTCRIGPRTPSGENRIEVETATQRRKFAGVTTQRLVVVSAADSPTIQSYDSANHAGGPTITLQEPPARRPQMSPTGRYLFVQGASTLMVANLPQEKVAKVEGLSGEQVTSWAAADDDRLLFFATESKKVYRTDLSAFPQLQAQQVSGAPPTSSLAGLPSGSVLGLCPDAAIGEGKGNVWYSGSDLQTFSWAQTGSAPFTLGSGQGITPRAWAIHDDLVALLVADQASTQWGMLEDKSGVVAAKDSGAASTLQDLTITTGGLYVAFSGAVPAPQLSYAVVADGAGLKTIALGSGSAASDVVTASVPAIASTVTVLVGPSSSGSFSGSTLEVVDLAQGKRLTSNGQAALGLADMRDSVGDPLNAAVHLITNTELRSYTVQVNGDTVELTDRPPLMALPAGRAYRWVGVQP